jgi:hypothetical protein
MLLWLASAPVASGGLPRQLTCCAVLLLCLLQGAGYARGQERLARHVRADGAAGAAAQQRVAARKQLRQRLGQQQGSV